jgi:predicted 3-demethylubiquinone-9 3-methyltransferase (glyoxalase superfamily)
MQKITPHIWFDKEARQAAEFYTSIFNDSKIKKASEIRGTPSGPVYTVSLEIKGFEFMFISAGPMFKVNPSVSFLVSCDTYEEVDALWEQLSQGGEALMEMGQYPFSERYGWIKDRYGVSWQLMYSHDKRQSIIPTLMFTGDVCGKAEEAINYYISVFKDGGIEGVQRYREGMEPDKVGTIQHAEFKLLGQRFAAMDSALEHGFAFNEAVSLIVNCEDQEEIDYYWSKLSAVPEAEQCGWLKDRYGFSWQIVPTIMFELLGDEDQEKVDRVTTAFLKMKKFNIEELEKASYGELKTEI